MQLMNTRRYIAWLLARALRHGPECWCGYLVLAGDRAGQVLELDHCSGGGASLVCGGTARVHSLGIKAYRIGSGCDCVRSSFHQWLAHRPRHAPSPCGSKYGRWSLGLCSCLVASLPTASLFRGNYTNLNNIMIMNEELPFEVIDIYMAKNK